MFRPIALSLTVILWSVGSLLLPNEARAETTLSRAVIELLRNQVRLIPQNQSARAAQPSDTMTPGDALATASSSMAQLRFNDGSLARLGQQVVFKFVPGSRTFTLSNGTALLLIPPGQGRTNVRTPNAAAGIRGSALFVRYIPETETTIVGALTNSGIEVFNQTASQHQELKAGYMAVIVKDQIQRVYEFDLSNFYRTSELVRGLNLTKTESTPSPDPAIASVQAETSQALKEQSQFAGEPVIENPSFVRLSTSTSKNFPNVNLNVVDGLPISGGQNPFPLQDTGDRKQLLDGVDNRNTLSLPSTNSDNLNDLGNRSIRDSLTNLNNQNNSNNGPIQDTLRNLNNQNNSNNGPIQDTLRNLNNQNNSNNGPIQDTLRNLNNQNSSNSRSNRDNLRNPNNRNDSNNRSNRDNLRNLNNQNGSNNSAVQNTLRNLNNQNGSNNGAVQDTLRNLNNQNGSNNGAVQDTLRNLNNQKLLKQLQN